MAKQVRVRILLDLALDDPEAVSEAACAMYAAMETTTGAATRSPRRWSVICERCQDSRFRR